MRCDTLAILGGVPAIEYALPSWNDQTGRLIGDEEIEELLQVVKTGHLGQVGGSAVEKFEYKFAEKLGVQTAVATSSGTAALHTAMVFAKVGPGDEVLLPCVTDMGTVIAVLLQNAVPVFVDIQPVTQNMDPLDLRRKITSRSKAIIAVHMFGYACDMDAIMEIATIHKLIVVEDCAQAHFSQYYGKYVGTIGHIGCFSFQQTKHITTGEGGMVVTSKDEAFGRKLKLCSDKGWPRETYREHSFLAPSYHMTELQAAVGVAQLRKVDEMLAARRASATTLTQVLSSMPGIKLPSDHNNRKHTYFAYQFEIEPDCFNSSRDDIVAAIKSEGVPLVPSYLPHPLYKYDFLQKDDYYNQYACPVGCPYGSTDVRYRDIKCMQAEQACKQGLFLGWNEKITESIATDIGGAIVKVLSYYKCR